MFEWSEGFVRATQWVGVVQVPGLQVEILPKVDVLAAGAEVGGGTAEHEARRNLLIMLAVSGDVPVRSRDIARLAARRAILSETLAEIFADRLRRELLRGPERGYVEQVENLRQFKGKLLVSRHVVRNAAHRERFWCRYDEFVARHADEPHIQGLMPRALGWDQNARYPGHAEAVLTAA